ncbi:MAG TPA: sialate O-acetylesterase, partial [Erythrobacter sp.]|nr:sialate O-acetylesterase [Erythrobacter sp.]
AVAVLIVIAMTSVGYLAATGMTLADARRETRISLGLPKVWRMNFQADITRQTPVDCPPANAAVIVTGGQSNAANTLSDSSWKVTPLAMKSGAVMLFDGQCYELADPVLGATGELESLWPTLAEKLFDAQTARRDTPRPLLFIHGAVGGSQIADWLDDRSTYRSRLVANIAEAHARGYKIDAVLWIQGETDAVLQVDPAQYQQDLQQLMHLIETESAMAAYGASWVFYRSTYCQGRETNGPDLEAALAKVSRRESGKVYIGPSLTDLSDTYRRDGCHLNNAGRDRIAEESAVFILKNSILSR